jgi:hypothetical protein
MRTIHAEKRISIYSLGVAEVSEVAPLIGTKRVSPLPLEGDQRGFASGSSKLNKEPTPGEDSSQMRPSMPSISSRQM